MLCRYCVPHTSECVAHTSVIRAPAHSVGGGVDYFLVSISYTLCASVVSHDHVKILGVHFASTTTYSTSSTKPVLRRVAGFLNKHGFLTLYKAQVRPYLEYGTLRWMFGAATHLRRLDKVERRAQ
ncbi:hypothetical protein E2C01_020976 [Portunus trituberculatus]|uniref:Uncharacterized protein n=1 Tax=Portunus trituberculatus TaxID=210409 RepID=A0A5B7E3G3_PORTR|nr:hypothetical protein [Portunus trituberculatus]